ncbi:MAG: AMP-binding protein [Candidatus Omnitrophica bacterium]|nr:AMP-binding protein [Candidatus Omnitrophota bacterium]
MARNLCDALTKRVFNDPAQIAIQWKKDDRWIEFSYGELYDKIKALSSAFSTRYGIRRGEKIAIMLGNRPEWPIVFFAALFAGAIPVPADTKSSPREVANILSTSDCKIAFVERTCPPIGIRTVSVDSDEFGAVLSSPEEDAQGIKAVRDDDACIMYTSGATSTPKGVVLSHGNILSNIQSLYKLGFMKPGDGIISVLPLYHSYAMVVTTIGPIVYGGRVIYPGSIRSKEVITAIRQSRAALFVGVPLIFEMFHRTIQEELKKISAPLRFLTLSVAELLYMVRKTTGINLSRYFFYPIHRSFGNSIRVCLSGGTKLKENVERDLFKFGFTVLNGYGMTEASPVLSVNPFRNPKIGSVGLPIANVQFKIINKDEHGIGELLVRGPNVMKGYYKNEELTRLAIEDGWLKTKDYGYIDKDGHLFLTGRTTDTIVLGTGLKVNPEEIEKIYMQDAPIKDMCIFGASPSKGLNNTPVLWAIIIPDMNFLEKNGIKDPYYPIKSALEKVSKELSPEERLMGFSLTLDTLPQTPLGKIKRQEVKKLHSLGKIRQVCHPERKILTEKDIALLKSPGASKILHCLRTYTGINEIVPSDSFELDLGIDILARAELASELEERLNIKIAEEEINKIYTVGELITHAGRSIGASTPTS